jgi:hypothetical protein
MGIKALGMSVGQFFLHHHQERSPPRRSANSTQCLCLSGSGRTKTSRGDETSVNHLVQSRDRVKYGASRFLT